MLLAACAAPVVAPRLIRGPQRTLRERAAAQHLALDRQGQQKLSSHQQNNCAQDTMETWNWHFSFDYEFLHVVRKIRAQELSDYRPG